MRIKDIFLISCLCLIAGCSTFGSKNELPENAIIRNQLVFVTPPQDFFIIDENIKRLNKNPSQKDIALWLVDNEARTELLENKLFELRNYYIKVYELLKSVAGAQNIIIIDPSKDDETIKVTVKDAITKPVVPK